MHEPSRTLVVAVADGVSAAPRSHVGAALAVRHATAAVVRQLERAEGQTLVLERGLRPGGLGAGRRAPPQRRGSARRCRARPATLATTLTVAVITRRRGRRPRVRVAAVGDSPAAACSADGFRALTGAETRADGPDRRRRAGAPPSPARLDVGARCASRRGEVLLLCTDGLALPLGDGTGEVGARVRPRAGAATGGDRFRAAARLQPQHLRRRPHPGRRVGGHSVSAVLAADASAARPPRSSPATAAAAAAATRRAAGAGRAGDADADRATRRPGTRLSPRSTRPPTSEPRGRGQALPPPAAGGRGAGAAPT